MICALCWYKFFKRMWAKREIWMAVCYFMVIGMEFNYCAKQCLHLSLIENISMINASDLMNLFPFLLVSVLVFIIIMRHVICWFPSKWHSSRLREIYKGWERGRQAFCSLLKRQQGQENNSCSRQSWWNLRTLYNYLLAWQVRITAGDWDLCVCVCVFL